MKRILLVLWLFLAGCEGFSPLVQLGVYWYEGEARKYYATERVALAGAARAALGELGLAVEREEERNGETRMWAGRGVFVRLTGAGVGVTRMGVRVRVFGDRPLAEMVFRHVDRQPGVVDVAWRGR